MASASKYAAQHTEPNGPNDARPTALDIIKDEQLAGKLTEKVILITGCSSGIGVETARALHTTGAHLYLTVRDLEKGKKVVQDILGSDTSNSGGNIELLYLELDDLQSVRECAAAFLTRSKQLNVLINNAGVMATPEGKTKDGFETQFGINHVGHFLLFQLLKPTLLASATPAFHSRVVCLSSGGHRFSPIHFDDLNLKKAGYQPFLAYGQSKTANIYLATEIERRYGAQHLHATAVHPGVINTELVRYMDPDVLKSMMTPEMQRNLKSPEQGAATTVWAAVGKDWEGWGGKYLEDCSESGPYDESATGAVTPGYAKHAFDKAAAKELWVLSLKLVGLDDDNVMLGSN